MSRSIEFFYFSGRNLPKLLDVLLKQYSKKGKYTVLDLGCGEGAVLETCFEKGYFDNAVVTGVDISKRLLNISKKRIKNRVKYKVSDVTKTGLMTSSFDVVYSIMVIEHLENPKSMVKEIKRILKPKGKAVISTIIKKPWAVYFYRNGGKFVIDPTHLHEFNSEEELKDMINKEGLKIEKQVTFPRSYSFIELFLKILLRLNLIKPHTKTRKLLTKSSLLSYLRKKLFIPVPGFYETQVIISK